MNGLLAILRRVLKICIRLLGKSNWVYIKRQQNDTKA